MQMDYDFISVKKNITLNSQRRGNSAIINKY